MVKKDETKEVKATSKSKTKTTKSTTKKRTTSKSTAAEKKTKPVEKKTKKTETVSEKKAEKKVTDVSKKKKSVEVKPVENISEEKVTEEVGVLSVPEKVEEKESVNSEKSEPMIEKTTKKKETHSFCTAEVVTLVVLTCIVSVAMGSFIVYSLLRKENPYRHCNFSSEVEEFMENYNYILENYAGEVSEEDLIKGAVEGMIETLDDPYAGIINPDDRSEQELMGAYSGIGLEVINNSDGNVEVYNVILYSPAKEVGILEGDIILSVDDLNLENTDIKVFSSYIKEGTVGQEYKLKVRRGEEEIDYVVTKEDLIIPSVFVETFTKNDKKIGYLNVTIFSATTDEQLQERLKDLENDGIDGLIIDVRGNSGGRLDTVANMLSNFLDSSHIIYQTDTKGEIETFYSNGSVTKQYPIVILTNRGSASASEVLAATLKEEYGATIVGTTTFGKGTVQQVKVMENGTEYKFTTKKWLTPKGNWIDGKGITPDYVVELSEEFYKNPSNETDNQLQKTLEVITNQ